MFVSIYYKPSLFNAHTMILIVLIFMNVNKLCLNQAFLTNNKSATHQIQPKQTTYLHTNISIQTTSITWL